LIFWIEIADPGLRDTAIFLAILSMICYFAFSERMSGFAGFILKIFSWLVDVLH